MTLRIPLRTLRLFDLALAGTLVLTCGLARTDEPATASIGRFSSAPAGVPPPPWHFATLPNKVPTRFTVVNLDGARVLKVEAEKSYGNLIYPLHLHAADHLALAWRWRIDQLVEAADLTMRSGDDGAAKLCVLFDLAKDKLSLAERFKLGLAHSETGEDVPAETLCYAWDNKLPPGIHLANAFTRRIRMIILESGTQKLGQWVAEKRDIVADYLSLFKEESQGIVPDIAGVAVQADADNTQGSGLAYFGDISLLP